jgi:hypothetical protein
MKNTPAAIRNVDFLGLSLILLFLRHPVDRLREQNARPWRSYDAPMRVNAN